jgi:dipeptidyl aminopeptidase/acylaminoacyl peptidase
MCQDYLDKLQAQGVPGELVVVKGAPHRITEGDKTDTSYQQKLSEWLEHHLR